MTNSYYNHDTNAPANRAVGLSATMRTEFDAVVAGFTLVDSLNPKLASANVFTLDNSFNGVNIGAGNYVGSGRNIRLGSGALGAATAGNDNVALGYQAMTANYLGQGRNTAVGSYALSSLTGVLVSDNTAIGYKALNAGTLLTNNTAVGSLAMETATGGSSVAVGYRALRVSTGTNNTAAGYDAGLANTSGSNNTFIGYQADGATATTSNAITLGNASIATLRCQVTSITALSDARDKTHVRPLPHGLDFTNSLRPVAFIWNTRDGAKVGIPSSGFIAQELQAAQDAAGATDTLNLVYDANPDKLEATYGHLIPVLVKAIQELSAKVEALENDRS